MTLKLNTLPVADAITLKLNTLPVADAITLKLNTLPVADAITLIPNIPPQCQPDDSEAHFGTAAIHSDFLLASPTQDEVRPTSNGLGQNA
jgi:hypothetical protein